MVKKGKSSQTQNVSLERMGNDMLAHKRQMFDGMEEHQSELPPLQARAQMLPGLHSTRALVTHQDRHCASTLLSLAYSSCSRVASNARCENHLVNRRRRETLWLKMSRDLWFVALSRESAQGLASTRLVAMPVARWLTRACTDMLMEDTCAALSRLQGLQGQADKQGTESEVSCGGVREDSGRRKGGSVN